MKKIALISTFCNTEEKQNLLKENIIKIKNLGIDVIAISPIQIPQDIVSLCDYFLYTKENPVFDWPLKSYFYWWEGIIKGINTKMTTCQSDYGFAGLLHIKRMADLALSMDYDMFFPMIYDLNFTPYVESIFNDNKKNSFFPSKRGDHSFWPVGLNLISLNREHLTRFKNLITKESYLTESKGDAFSWTQRALDFIPGIIEKEPVEDLIYYYSISGFYNFSDYSIIEGVKLFIHKIKDQDIKFIFYDFKDVKNFIIKTEEFEYEYNIKEWEEIELPYKEYDSFIVVYKEKEYDFTDIISKITFNTFTKTLN
jgi:hypothetical protein